MLGYVAPRESLWEVEDSMSVLDAVAQRCGGVWMHNNVLVSEIELDILSKTANQNQRDRNKLL